MTLGSHGRLDSSLEAELRGPERLRSHKKNAQMIPKEA